MPYLETAQSWLTQSTLLLKARPSTTRMTTKYTITTPTDPSKVKPRKAKASSTTPDEPSTATPATASDAPRATLTLKTFDPASGATLKYRTNKAAEVSRLIQILGRLARPMSGLPEVKEDVPMVSAGAGGDGEGSGAGGVGTPTVENVPAVAGGGKPGQQAGGGLGGKKKKKGKK